MMDTAVPQDFKIISTCEECLVRSMCTLFCLKWINKCTSKFPLDVEIPFSEFRKVMSTCGPLDNYFKEQYPCITAITFPDDAKEKVIISIDRNNVLEDACY